jgi:ankyrin repeat protein
MWPCLCALYALCAVGRADVNSRNKRGNTPLMQAAEKGRVTVVQALLDAKADPTLTNPRRLTAREVSSVPVSPGSALARPPPLSGPADSCRQLGWSAGGT